MTTYWSLLDNNWNLNSKPCSKTLPTSENVAKIYMLLEEVIFFLYNDYRKGQVLLHSFLSKALISVSVMEISQHLSSEGRRIFVAFWHKDVGGGFLGG